jgi:hypothetical protein
MYILITKDDFYILMEIVIVDPTHIDMVQQALMMTSHVTTMIA